MTVPLSPLAAGFLSARFGLVPSVAPSHAFAVPPRIAALSQREISRLLVRVRPSVRLGAVLIAAHALVALATCLSGLPHWVVVGTVTVVAASAALHLRRYAWLNAPASIVFLDLTDNLECEARQRDGTTIHCTVASSTFVSPAMTVINLKPQSARLQRHVIILPDSMDSDTFRALRVWLRWRRAEPEPGGNDDKVVP